MNRIVGLNYQPSWRPMPRLPDAPTRGRSSGTLGQGLLEGKSVSVIADFVTALSSAYLAWGLGTRQNKWSTLWWVVSAAATVKGLHDMSRPDR